MCGILGFVGSGQYKTALSRMLSIQAHRGPDFTGTYFDEGFAAMGHNRLSIIDLSSSANQPFQDHSGRYIMVFNGEIYNYLELKNTLKQQYNFITSSDTEVLLAAFCIYGKGCLDMVNGMFAFAIWDKKDKTLFAARDRFGIKPFYYFKNAESFIFSSEIKTIHETGVCKAPNEVVWGHYFLNGSYGQPHETFWEGIQQLPAGHYLEFSEGKLHVESWYDFVYRVKNKPQITDYQEAQAVYENLLIDSITLRCRADVPIGFNISGGLDSSALLAMANISQHDISNIEAFTFYTGDENYDELPWVNQMIERYKNPLQKVCLTSNEVPSLAKKISHFQDEPYGGLPTLAYSKVFHSASKKGVKVLLDGQGMDEQLAGYDYYQKNSYSTIQGVHKSPFKRHLFNTKWAENFSKVIYPKPFESSLENLQYRDLFYTKIPRALRFNDRISMAFSTELRVPFLDYRLVELGVSLPKAFKIKNHQGKQILRDIVANSVGNNVSYAPKRPLQTPQREWLGRELNGFVEYELEKIKSTHYSTWFNMKAIDLEWQNYLAGDNQSSFHIWQLVNFALLMA
ncbi:asparagine synthase (glutamine-hydrolyzing) [Tamlana fucoidanivorans]|uniref:asparagine synthase (glutamine-hydrolyzing) n=1 Tax=Allotamlana fucoidanivorans TaxID=2583814 RepID=A0A5C4SNK0_9FLAO|nr:asparagine synthase (glutamine-hydrolyzing) [Tamlana fucoidanivorans]TNJ45755.1 asparagine synthase (glutamine-hydrolyzing) [Tamlana fucoidanivorans]